MEPEFLPLPANPMEMNRNKPPQPAGPSAIGRIRRLEEITIDAWPALETSLFDGWVIRFAGGFSRRSNSVIPLYPSEREIREKIRTCESLFRGRGMRTVFKLTAASLPPELDAILAEEGYRREAETSVRVLARETAKGTPADGVAFRTELEEEWMSALCALNAYDPRHHGTVRAITEKIGPPRVFASVRRGGRIVGCGLGVVRQGHAVLFDIVVDGEFRRQGMGGRIVESLLCWGGEQSAGTAFLQVMTNNPPALAMYNGLGFQEVYRYWYRVKE
jgi:ribosomal protein S18 acetylase RimI-like enzyme